MLSNAKRRAVALMCVLAVLGAACGSGSTTSTSTAAPSNQAEDSASQAQESAPTAVAGTPAGAESTAATESPLADLLGIPLSDDDAMTEYFGQLQRDAEVKISECMLSQGFEYKAVDYSVLDGIDSNIDFDSKAFAEEYGFGITSNPFEESFEAFQDFEDPNQAYLETLSPGESEAYQTALNGELPDFDASSPDEGFEPAGCQGEAYEEVFSFGLVFDQFANELEEVEQQYDADPRIVRAGAGWSTCMTEAGVPLHRCRGRRRGLPTPL